MEKTLDSASTGPAVAGSDLEVIYGTSTNPVRALSKITLSVPRGQFLCILGRSGSGKSTLLHVLAGLRAPTSGVVRIGDREIQSLDRDEVARFRRRNVGLVFQFFNLIPTLSVQYNVALPLLLDRFTLSQVQDRLHPLVEELGLAGRLRHMPDQLSGGEMQRVAIARALIAGPKLVLADEPTGNLDSRTGDEVLGLLRRLVDTRNLTLILATHDLAATSYADRVITLADGRIVEDT